jgi:hypothetical protein
MVKTKINLTGQKFGRLTVISKNAIGLRNGSARWNCVCDCGNKTVVTTSNLINIHTGSCGCLWKETVTTHGMSSSPEYRIWSLIIQRCINSNCPRYHDYGGRGITVCDRWLNSFEAFYEDMGPRPSPDHSIDRRENDGNYEKNNCKWSTRVEQQNNKRNNVFYEYNGRKYQIAELIKLPEALINRVCHNTLVSRLQESGWSVEDAINTSIKVQIARTYVFNGITKTISEWSEEYNVDYHKLYRRLIRDKWDFERAVTTP